MQPLSLPFSKPPSLNDFLYIAVESQADTCNSREKQTNNESIYILPVNIKWKNLKLFQMYFSSEITVVAYLILVLSFGKDFLFHQSLPKTV